MDKDHQDTTTDEAKAREAVRQRKDEIEFEREMQEIYRDFPCFFVRQMD